MRYGHGTKVVVSLVVLMTDLSMLIIYNIGQTAVRPVWRIWYYSAPLTINLYTKVATAFNAIKPVNFSSADLTAKRFLIVVTICMIRLKLMQLLMGRR